MSGKPRTVLIVAAHPDDEALGCGGTMARLVNEGALVHVAFLADGVGARHAEGMFTDEEIEARRAAARTACKILGTEVPQFDDFPDNRLDTIPRLQIVQRVESILDAVQPDTVLTHHVGDVNIDHRRVHEAVVTACRPQPGHPVRRLMFFEVASSTEWQPPGSAPAFQPQCYVDITETLSAKLEALRAYDAEMRPWPHARSIEAVEHHARWRGATVGCEAAEAFMVGRELW